MKKLFICEKPSMAIALADYFAGGSGKAVKENDYYKVGDNYIAALKGHIMVLYEPEDYRPDWAMSSLSYSQLPMLPEVFKKKIKDSYGKDANGEDIKTDAYQKIFDRLKILIGKVDVVVNSGDADAEGQILVDEVVDALGWQGAVERIFINAYDDASIKRALDNIEDNKSDKNRNLSKAAECRAITDWLIGLNGSRKFTLDSASNIAVGRVKCPIMGLIKRRNDFIDNFKSIKYYEPTIFAKFGNNVPFPAVWKPKKDASGLDSENRLVDVTVAREIIQKVDGKPVKVLSVAKEHRTESPKLPFNLAKLQAYACSKLGVSLKELDGLLQDLYENKKLLTYPRSDCQYIPESQLGDAEIILANLKVSGDKDLKDKADRADAGIKNKAFNTSKTSAHHAIIPTTVRVDLDTLSSVERNLYKIVAERYIMQFYPLHEYDTTEMMLQAEDEKFSAKGKVVTRFGWKSLLSEDEMSDDGDDKKLTGLPELEKGSEGVVVTTMLSAKDTVPPERFTQETLITALTNAYKYVNDKNLADIIKSIKGIGTPATRSIIIESLLSSGLLEERKVGDKSKKKYLFVSEKASNLVDCLPTAITYPDQTAIMELDLEKIAAGTMEVAEYRKVIDDYVCELLKVESRFDRGELCPVCKKGYLRLAANGNNWFCTRWNDSSNKCNTNFANVGGKPWVEKCPSCSKGYIARTKLGNLFCTAFKQGCNSVFDEVDGKVVLRKEEICPVCGKGFVRKSSKGIWYCTEFRNEINPCNARFDEVKGKPVLRTDITCPVCRQGVLRKNKEGTSWYCSNLFNETAKCDAFFVDVGGKPYLDKCPVCGKGDIRRAKSGSLYCSEFRNGCNSQFTVQKGVLQVVKEMVCPACKRGVVRKSSKGNWYCTEFKTCNAYFRDEKGKPVLVVR